MRAAQLTNLCQTSLTRLLGAPDLVIAHYVANLARGKDFMESHKEILTERMERMCIIVGNEHSGFAGRGYPKDIFEGMWVSKSAPMCIN